MQRRSFLQAMAAIGLASAGRHAAAQGKYPDRPVVLVVPYAAGGASAVFGQKLALKMSPLLGANIVQDPKGGAGGVIGTQFVARAKPDGYTLLLASTGSHIISPLTYAEPPFDPLKDFAPIALLVRQPMVLAVGPALGVTSVQGLIELIRKEPRKHSFASAGTGALGHLTGELFLRRAGNLDAVHVPYKGGGPALTDVMAGNASFIWEVMSSVVPLHHSGKLRMLAIADDKRAQSLPQVPTAIESGLSGFVSETAQFLLAPAGTPAPIIGQLATAIRGAMGNAEFQRDLVSAGIEPVAESAPTSTEAFIARELGRWGPLVRSLGLRAG